jgi:hypothetical protein
MQNMDAEYGSLDSRMPHNLPKAAVRRRNQAPDSTRFLPLYCGHLRTRTMHRPFGQYAHVPTRSGNNRVVACDYPALSNV